MPTLKEALANVPSGIVLDATDTLGPGNNAEDDYPAWRTQEILQGQDGWNPEEMGNDFMQREVTVATCIREKHGRVMFIVHESEGGE